MRVCSDFGTQFELLVEDYHLRKLSGVLNSQPTRFSVVFTSTLIPIAASRHSDTCPNMSMNQESLTVEETNKVRVSLGLAPIGGPVPEGEDAPVDADAVAEANYAQRRDEMKKAKAEADLKERIAK